MIPSFCSNNYLPPGIHAATLAQIRKHYAYTARRTELYVGLVYLAKVLKTAGCKTLYLNGSYVTNKVDPADYDAIWECDGVDNTIDPLLREGWNSRAIKRKYGGDVFCRMPEVLDQDHLKFFQTDRDGIEKGIIKIDLRKAI